MRSWDVSPTGRNGQLITIASIILAIILSSCATLNDPESSQEYNSNQIGVVNPTTNIGQSIRTTLRRVNGITFWFSKPEQQVGYIPGEIIITIFQNSSSNNPLFTTSISSASVTQFTPIQVSFPASTVPQGNPFFVLISTVNDEVIVHGRLEDCYPAGQAYQNRHAFNADLAFRVTYYYGAIELGQDIIGFLSQIKYLFIALAILLIPGYAIVRLFGINKYYPAAEQLALSVGLSIAIIPIIYLYTTNLGISLTQRWVQVIGVIFTLIIIATLLKAHAYLPVLSYINKPQLFFQNLFHSNPLSRHRSILLLLSILLIALLVRAAMVRDLATPAWVDSIHHGLITRLIIENGSLPQSYLPYLEIESTLYHPGFHSTLATFIYLSGMSIYDGMLYWGQILNAAIALAVFLLAVILSRRQSAGLIAALIASSFMAMPAYYTSWGRYPQLTGLIILPIPAILLMALDNASEQKEKLKLLFCAAIAITGLFLVHYRVVAFLACLLLPLIITKIILARSNFRVTLINYTVRILILVLLTALISSAWLIPAIRDTFVPRLAPTATEPSLNFFSDFSWHYLTPIYGKQVIVLAVIGTVWALLRKQMLSGTIVGWVILLFFVANLGALNLPGGSFINNSSVAIMLFMPLAVAAGDLIAQISSFWRQVIFNRSTYLVCIIVLAVTAYISLKGSQQLLPILNPTTILSRQADLAAIHWVDKNIPDDELILINPFAWGYGLYAGSDGGAWIPTIAGNQTIPPPVLYGLGSEIQKKYVNQVCAEVIRLGSSPEELWNYLLSTDIEYIYIGARGGPISPSSLANSSHFETVYQQQNSWLFRILP